MAGWLVYQLLARQDPALMFSNISVSLRVQWSLPPKS
jgi:hypothetical protein